MRPNDTEVSDLTGSLLEEAAELFLRNYAEARRRQPLLPARQDDEEEAFQRLARLAEREQGVAVMRGDRLVGFGVGLVIPDWHGWRTALMPEWAHATVPAGCADICRVVYEALSRRWAADGRLCHLVGMLADGAPLDGWQWMGFGLQCVDAVRDLTPPACPPAPCTVRQARPSDATKVTELTALLAAELSEGPVFLPRAAPPDPGDVEARLADPDRACFLAHVRDETAGYMTVRRNAPEAGWVIQDPGTAGIDGAYVMPRYRGQQVAKVLLCEAVRWAQDSGYVRCAVDFEAHNARGARFWLRHFEPVSYVVVRVIGAS
jgi:GNAT superfamily N-acetyltransferase